MELYTVWGWLEDGAELLDTWSEWDVEGNPEGYEAALKKAYEKTQVPGSGFWHLAGIRVVKVNVDYEAIEALFNVAAIEGTLRAEDPHPLVAFAQRVAAFDDPENAEAQADRQTVTLSKLQEAARAALDASGEIVAVESIRTQESAPGG